jgi:membrane-associated PAP2 superfamily phosphatase
MRAADIASTKVKPAMRPRNDDGPGRFLLLHLGPALVVLLALLLIEASPLDRLVSDLFFDAASRTFPLRNDFFLDAVMHRWAKYVVIAIGITVLVACVLSLFVARLVKCRRVLVFLALALGLAPAVVSALKAASPRSCPYDLAAYGGYAPHLGLFEATAAPFGPGHCFPGGHASAGFCLLAFYFVGYALKRPQLARAGLVTGIIAGLALGAGRVAQGAHFLSHNLWTGLICWTVIVLVYLLILGPRRTVVAPAQAVAAAPALSSAPEHAI